MNLLMRFAGFFSLVKCLAQLAWRPVYGPRLLVLSAILILGSLPAPEHPAASAEPSTKPARHSTPRARAARHDRAAAVPVFPFAADEDGQESTRSLEPPAPAPAGAESSATAVDAPDKKIIAGWLPFWDMHEGMRVVDEFPDALTEVSPFWYEVGADGTVVNSPGAENSDVLAKLRARGKAIIPTIMSADGPSVSSVLNDEAKRSLHLRQIMKKVKNPLYDGIDIDYENLPAADKDAFSRFVRDLAARVHRKGKKLMVTVNSKTSDPGTWNGPQSHDYAAIGEAADFVRVMAYDQHYAGGPPGPVAAVDWVDQVAAFSVSRIPKEKVVLGIPAYGYDWPAGGRAKSMVHDEAAAKSLAHQAPIQWDEKAASSYFQYSDETGAHTVWFENNRSLQAKLDVVKKYGLAGVAIWRLGREDKTGYLSLIEKYLTP